MKIEIKDYYGQHVTIHNDTGSGNLRLEVKTTESLNDLHKFKKEECPITTDISLDLDKIKLLHTFLENIINEYEE
jgi:hypothetical protein